MKCFSFILFLALAFHCNPAMAESNWILIAADAKGQNEWYVQPGSFEFSKTRGGNSVALVVGKILDKKYSNIQIYKWYVTAEDCGRKMGKVISLNLDGEFIFENDFVSGSGNIATAIADVICGVAEHHANEVSDKSI